MGRPPAYRCPCFGYQTRRWFLVEYGLNIKWYYFVVLYVYQIISGKLEWFPSNFLKTPSTSGYFVWPNCDPYMAYIKEGGIKSIQFILHAFQWRISS